MLKTSQERKKVRQYIETYHQNKLKDLQQFVFKKFKEFYQGKIDAFDLDQVIHAYHQQSRELFKFINTYYTRSASLEMLLDLIEQEKRGEWIWQPKTQQKTN